MAPAKPNSLLDRWNQFWFQPVASDSLGLVRLWTGLILFWKCTGSYALVRLGTTPVHWQFPRVIFDVQTLGTAWWMPWPGFGWLPTPSQLWLGRLVLLLTVLSLCVAAGLFTRVTTTLTALLLTYLFLLSQWNYHHHMVLFICVLWILAFAPAGRRYSLDAHARESREPHTTWILPLRLLQVLVSAIYLFSFISKCDPSWWDGSLMKLYHDLGAFRGPYIDFVFDRIGYRFAGILITASEAFLAFGLLVPQTRRLAWAVGIVAHLSIDFSMEVSTYGYQMLALYTAFLVPASGTTVVLFDGRCNMCKASRRWSRLLDWFDRVSWMDFRRPETQQQVPFLSSEEMEKKMYVITHDGRVFSGYQAWREILARFPLTFLPSFLCYLPPLNLIGGHVYQFIADRRKLSCEVELPTTQESAAQHSLAAARERERTS